MASETHPIVVKTNLTPEEFFALEAMREQDGLSQSAFIRQLIKHKARTAAAERQGMGPKEDFDNA